MAHRKSLTALTTILAFAGLAACAGDNPPPQTPADQTTVTAATPNQYQSNQSTNGLIGQGTTPYTGTPAPGDITPGTTTGAAAGTGAVVAPGNPSTGMNGTGGTSNVATSGDTAPHAEASLSDAQIVSVIQAADTGEIAQAHEAIRKAKNARVKRFAQHMITDHSAAETKVASVDSKADISPQASAISEELKTNGDQIMSDLKSATGSSFDQSYMDAQVKEHTKVLDLLDNKLIPQAQNSDLVKTLREIRTKVAGHLKDAQDIQTSLQTQ